MRTLILALLLGLPLAGRAGTFDVGASVDRNEVELGETLRLTLQVSVQGQLAFPPQMDQPRFDGFEARGPQQMQNVSWVNGSVSVQQSLTWELTAVKAGTLSLGPYEVRAKDALNGEIKKSTQAIQIRVRRPKDLGLKALAQPRQDAAATDGLTADDDVLRDIKPDRPFPWLKAGLWAALGLGLLALLLTWWRRRPPPPTEPPPPRDPAQWALERLEKLRQTLQPGGEAAFVLEAAALLRDYLRHRLRLRYEATQGEGLRELRRQAPSLEGARELGQLLTLILYGNRPAEPADADAAYEGLRALIIGAERALPRPQAPEAGTPSQTKPNPKTRGKHGKRQEKP